MAIEGGQEVFIPKELSQDQLPMSYHYYDPLLNIVQFQMGQSSKDKF